MWDGRVEVWERGEGKKLKRYRPNGANVKPLWEFATVVNNNGLSLTLCDFYHDVLVKSQPNDSDSKHKGVRAYDLASGRLLWEGEVGKEGVEGLAVVENTGMLYYVRDSMLHSFDLKSAVPQTPKTAAQVEEGRNSVEVVESFDVAEDVRIFRREGEELWTMGILRAALEAEEEQESSLDFLGDAEIRDLVGGGAEDSISLETSVDPETGKKLCTIVCKKSQTKFHQTNEGRSWSVVAE
ncbi:hypothetical protein TrST_g11724 [Triparma strigata]|uniref:Uncharacterized protein n=1 Tax=Triparma strigata TaxID=1606541 RepID=A0A9W6ZML1_9STRA|nr:hypothetical protein TrST_g11724 [Triparma strigata]